MDGWVSDSASSVSLPLPSPSGGERKVARRNFIAHSIEGGLFGGALAFVAPDTLLPPVLDGLGAPNWLIAISPQLMLLGFIVTPLFFAHRAEGRERQRPLVLFWGFFQRLPFLLAALVLFGAALFPDWAVIASLALAPFTSGLFGGIAVSGWSALVAKTVRPQRRASVAAVRNTVAGLIGIAAGLITERLLDVVPGVSGYAWLHLIAYAVFMLSYLAFLRIQETATPQQGAPKTSVLSSLKGLSGILRTDRRFCYFLASLSFSHGILIILPFLSIHALNVLDAPTRFVGVLLAAKSAGIFFGNILGGIMGDRWGGKSVFLTAYACFLLVALLSLIVTTQAGFLFIFFLFGMGFPLRIVGQQTLTLELAPPGRLPSYFALALSGTAPFMLIAAGITIAGKEWADRVDAFWPLAVPSAIALVIALFFMSHVKEPRGEQPT